MQLPVQQLSGLPLEGLPVQGTGSVHIGRLHAEAARTAWSELPAAIEHSINVSFAVPKGFSHGAQRVPDAMLPFSGSYNLLPDAGQAPQVSFEQHGADPLQDEPVASGTREAHYPHLSDEHRDLIDKVILHAADQQKYRESTLQKYTYTLRRLANDLGASGQATDLINHQSLVDHANAFFPNDDEMKKAVNVLRAYHEPGYSVTVGAPAIHYPHLSDEHRDVINKAIGHAAAQQHPKAPTLRIYSSALRRLANDLGARGLATDLKDHQSLVNHVNAFFPKNVGMKTALSVLRAYYDPGYSASGPGRRPVPVPSKADARVIELVTGDSSLASSTRVVYGRSLRRFSEALESQGLTISGLDHDSRIKFAGTLLPVDRYLRLALERVRDAEAASHRGAEALLFDEAYESPTNPEKLLRLEHGFREALQRAEDDQAASSFFSGPRMPAGPGDLNSIVADAFAATASGHAGVEAAAPPALTASQQQIRPSLDPGQGDHLPTGWVIINNEHSTALLTPAKRQRALNTPQAAITQQPLSEIGISGGLVPMQLPVQQLSGLPLEGLPVQGTGSVHIGRLHAEAARTAWSELPAAIEHSINVSFAVPKGFSHGAQRVPDAMLPFLNRHGLLPDAEKPEWNYEIKGHGNTAERPEGRNDFWLVDRGRTNEAAAAAVPPRGPASPATARLSDTYRGVPLVDLTTSSDARMGALPSASSNFPPGAVLGPELLDDAHISRDYQLLEQNLQAAHPALAARTRLVDPLVSQQLRRPDRDPQLTLRSIYHHSDVAADFVFLPVNSGNPLATVENEGPPEHWSLLLVDRRDPERAVAYHYDSIPQRDGRGYNDAPARELAARLDATTLVTPAMARQNNGVDCGVFVVDGTRALVQRLANQEWPERQRPLHLDNLIADRQALQNRLRQGRLPHELAAVRAEALGVVGSQVQHAVLQEQQARQVASAPFDQHLSKSRGAQNEMTSTLDRSNRVNSGGVIINNEHYTALLRPGERQKTDNPQSLAIGQLGEATATSISQAPDQARADLMASSRSRERSDAGR
ncbi:peptidase C48 [Mesorhizobium sp. M00.F.Ca.ET.158.01.1.1]|nr:peptidase C48 [Mesorhizobium sp. M00.F.Ca.ET.158.01.1.1]